MTALPHALWVARRVRGLVADGETIVIAGYTGFVHGVQPSGEPRWLTETGQSPFTGLREA